MSPWKCVHAGFVSQFLDQVWLIVVDAHSKWPEVARMK